MFRKRINDLLNEIGEVLDDYAHLGYDIAFYEKPKPHINPIHTNCKQLVITLINTPGRHDNLIKWTKDEEAEYLKKLPGAEGSSFGHMEDK